jgi:TolB-like protein
VGCITGLTDPEVVEACLASENFNSKYKQNLTDNLSEDIILGLSSFKALKSLSRTHNMPMNNVLRVLARNYIESKEFQEFGKQ